MPTLVPSLWFDGNAEEAARFYTSVFPNSTIHGMTKYGPDQPGPEGTVMVVSFSLDGVEFVGINGGPQFPFTEAVSFQVLCRDQEEVDFYWERLTDGGEPGPCGWLKDRFGLSWQVVPRMVTEAMSNPEPERDNRVMKAVLGMGKLDVETLERAAAGQDR